MLRLSLLISHMPQCFLRCFCSLVTQKSCRFGLSPPLTAPSAMLFSKRQQCALSRRAQVLLGDAKPSCRLPARFAPCRPNQYKSPFRRRRRASPNLRHAVDMTHTLLYGMQPTTQRTSTLSLVAAAGVVSMMRACALIPSPASMGNVMANGSRIRTEYGISESTGR